MNNWLENVEQDILAHALLIPGQPILVAVSGGADSMVLLHALHVLSVKYRWHLTVGHFNHRLRGTESEADERLVRQVAANKGLACVVGSGNVGELHQQESISVEMAARELRQRFFAETASRLQIHTVVLGHHADDQVELFFIRLLRGAGGDGLGGMHWKNPLPSMPDINLARPFLNQSRTSIREFAREMQIPFREDDSNQNCNFLRNRIRKELIPLIVAEYQPALSKSVFRAMEVIRPEAEFAANQARNWLRQSGAIRFSELHLSVQRQVIVHQMLNMNIQPRFGWVEWLRMKPGSGLVIHPGLVIYRNDEGVLCEKSDQSVHIDQSCLRLDLHDRSSSARFGDLTINWRIEVCSQNQWPSMVTPQKAALERRLGQPSSPQRGVEIFDAESVGRNADLRFWQPGDRFRPIGLPGKAKLQDLFVNARIPRHLRHQVVLARNSHGEVFWVQGLRIGECCKVTKTTRQILEWRWDFSLA